MTTSGAQASSDASSRLSARRVKEDRNDEEEGEEGDKRETRRAERQSKVDWSARVISSNGRVIFSI